MKLSLFLVLIKYLYFSIEDALVFVIKRAFKLLIALFFIITLLLFNYTNQSMNSLNYVRIKIPKDIVFNELTDLLLNNNLIKSEFEFKLVSKYLGYDKKIKSGEFDLPWNMNTYNLVKILLTIKPIQRKITLIEGLQYSKICSILAKGLDLDSIKLNQLYTSNKLLKKYNIPAENIEGYIYPQTYLFNWGQTEFEIIDYLLSQMKEQLEELKDSISESNYTVHEIITLASIIEAESNFADEKPIVSSVYHNRLKKGWKLQADPTIIYILGKPQRVLFKHLEIDSPYNTYLYEGLPKGPINNPGIDAIKAAVFPADTKYMYFTGTGDGTGKHLFASSLIGHNKNRRQLDAARKNINKK